MAKKLKDVPTHETYRVKASRPLKPVERSNPANGGGRVVYGPDMAAKLRAVYDRAVARKPEKD